MDKERKCYLKELNGKHIKFSFPINTTVKILKQKIGLKNNCSEKDIKIIYKSKLLKDNDNIIFGECMIYMICKNIKNKNVKCKKDDNKSNAVEENNNYKFKTINICHILSSLLKIFGDNPSGLINKLIELNAENESLIYECVTRNIPPIPSIIYILEKDYNNVLDMIKKENYDIKPFDKKDWLKLKDITIEMKLNPMKVMETYYDCGKNIDMTFDIILSQ
jgi:hypothetical protein